MHKLSVLILGCTVLTVLAAAQEFPAGTPLPALTPAMQPAAPPFELTRLRTDWSRSYLNKDSSVTAHIQAGVRNTPAADIATKGHADTPGLAAAWPRTIETEAYTYRFDAGDTGAGFRFEHAGHFMECIPTGDWSGIETRIITGASGIKETVIFTEKAPSTVAWRMVTDTVMAEYDGGIRFSDDAGATLFDIHRADAFDARGRPVEVRTAFADGLLRYTLATGGDTAWPVILDPSVTITGMLDGRVESRGETVYTDARNAIDGFNYATAIIAGQDFSTEYRVYRSYLAFPIPDLASASACTLYIDGRSNKSDTDFDLYILGASEYRSELDSYDFTRFDGYQSGATFTGTTLNETWNSSAFTLEWNAIIFNAAGLDSIEAAANDTLWIALISKKDYDNTSPTGNEYLLLTSSADETGKPYLSLTYTPETSPPPEFTITAHEDGRIRTTGEPVYADARDAVAASSVDRIWTQVGQLRDLSNTYDVYRGFFSFVLPDIYTVNACTLYVNGYNDRSGDTEFDVCLTGASAYGPTLDSGDFSRFDGRQTGGAHTGAILSAPWNSSSYDPDWNAIVFNAAGLDSVRTASGDTLRIAMISSRDYQNIAPTGEEFIIFESSSYPAVAPYLSLDYSAGIAPPADFTMSALDDSTIACSWGDLDGETAYRLIDRSDMSAIAILAADATADTITGLTANTRYVWSVMADSLGVTGLSVPDSCYTLLMPPAPADVRIMPISSDTLRITVAAPANALADDTGMEAAAIQGSGADGSGWLDGAYVFLDGGLDCTDTYRYAVRYTNGDGIPSAWSDTLVYAMNGLAAITITPAGDSDDDYTAGGNAGTRTATVVRAGAADDGTVLEGFVTFNLPWHVQKGGIDSVFVTLTREAEENLRTPELVLSAIPGKDTVSAETIDLGAQEITSASVPWMESPGTGERTSPNLREIFREWQDSGPVRDHAVTFALRLGGAEQPDSVRTVFRDVSYPSWDGDTFLTVYYTPGNPDSLDAAPRDVTLTAVAPDSVIVRWTDTSAFELGFIILNAADSTVVAGTGSLAENTTIAGVGGLTPNTSYQWFVRAFSAVDSASSQPAGVRTPARVPGAIMASALSDSSISFIIDPVDNPSTTAFAVMDSLSGHFLDSTVEPTALRAGPAGEWAWRTWNGWGAAAGDTLFGLAPDSLYVLRAKARTDE